MPFGSYLNFMVKAIPEIKDETLRIHINEFKVGSLKIPASALNFVLKIESGRINSAEAVKNLTDGVKQLKTENNGIYIVYSPKKLSALLSSGFIKSLK